MKRRIYLSLLLVTTAMLIVLVAGGPKGHTNQGGIHTIPESWRGTWEVTVAYRDRNTGALVATDVTTAEICPGEPIIPPELRAQVLCSESDCRQRHQRLVPQQAGGNP